MTSFSTVNGLAVDPSVIRNANYHNPNATSASFDSALNKFSSISGLVGPVVNSALSYAGLGKGATMANAAISGFSGGSSPYNAYSPVPGANSKMLSFPGAPPGFPGGGAGAAPGMGGFPGMGGGLTDTAGIDSQISAMFNNNMVFLGVQARVQNMAQTATLLTNISKTDHDAKMSAVRNARP